MLFIVGWRRYIFAYYIILFIVGWGRYDPNHNTGSPKLKQTYVPIADHQTCRKVNGGSVREKQMVCAGGKGTSVCNGDSGGPLSCEENGRWVLRGAASWVTDRKCPGDTYSVYARVSEYIDWIYKHIQGNHSNKFLFKKNNTCSL